MFRDVISSAHFMA